MNTKQTIEDTLANDRLSLYTKREIIDENSYSDAFPTSPAAQAAREWREALKTFDAEHPEILRGILEKEKAADAQRKATPLKWI